ncbi:serine/threonine protein kinase [Nocardiopsis exhalans]|uniref:Serine/threonine protein kinase n=1 Tax=Nocardiopsis exhalans TaxID=163604 RepID=A0ABY5D3N5_9ACTN|nr:serine/threonine-protein kinase [Nocardiopsis exhalans]USY17713.1 serine/threonine protein kinase [Nocardiopsis exhalans]
MDEPQNQDTEVERVGGYRLLRSLGRGGFGEVFLGEAEDGTRAAVKILHASWAGDADMRRRFAAEVEQAQRVSGFCVAEILDADPAADQPWIATEYIDGPTLQASVATDGPRSGTELQRLAVATATALAAIHAAGVVHRDLKPDNIMLAQDGPRVIDFGIARAVESTSVTASGVVGTIGYMAPEQLEGARLTAAVDVFAWASVMVFAATGREAFHGPTQAARIARILGGEPDLGGLEGAFADTLRTCMAKDPRERPDAEALMRQLISAPAAGAPARAPRPIGDHAATAVVSSPDAATRVGVEGTRVAEHPPAGVVPVDPTRVAPPAKVDPTRAYTRMAPADAQSQQARSQQAQPQTQQSHHYPQPPPFAQSAPHSAPHSRRSGPHTPVPGPTGPVPPYHFVGVRFLDPGTLAEAMQRNWGAAVQVFSDPVERAALGAWIMDDLGDTTVDRALFRREVRDANLAVASFIAQTRPDLPPVFRGRGISLTELRELFTDPRPLLTGAPLANEMVLLARPELLRLISAHHGPESAEYQRLAEQLDRAERAGNLLHQQLAQQLEGWRSTTPNVNPALVLAFLLNPGQMVPPTDNGDPGVAEWVDILWQRVMNSDAPDNAGYAAAIHGSTGTLQALSRQRRYWESRYSEVSTAHEALLGKVRLQERLDRTTRLSKFALLGLPVGFVMYHMGGAGEFFGNLAMWVGLIAVPVLLGAIATNVVICGRAARRRQRAMELHNTVHQLPQLTSGVERIRADLAQARRLTAG